MTESRTEIRASGLGQVVYPESPSWVDRLTRWVDKLPGPAWLYYGCGALLAYAAYVAVKWWDGSVPSGTYPRVAAVVVGSMFYYVALLDYLNKVASRAMSRFRPASDASDEMLAILELRLTNMPARMVWAATVAGLVFGSLTLVAASQGLMYTEANPFTSAPATLLETAVVLGLSASLLIFVAHTVQQLRTIDILYTRYTKIDLFDLGPVYAFSQLSARTAIGVILLQILWQTGESWMAVDAVTLLTGAAIILLAIATFVWPLKGLNRLLVEEKRRLKSAAGQRLKTSIENFNRCVDEGEVETIEKHAKAVEGADLESRIVNRIPTWPWQPETLRSVTGAILLPVFLWLVTRLLEQVFAF
jgi:hypothetical protein